MERSIMKKHLLLLVILFVLTSACNTSVPAVVPSPTIESAIPSPTVEPSPTITPTETPLPPTETPIPNTPTPEPVHYGPDNFPSDVNPLTGLKVDNAEILNRRPVGVKIQAFPRGQRPPWGVTLADIVYNYYNNNGLTRLHAIFYGQDAEQAGPIRSARLFDSSIVRMYKSIFVFGGADKRILNQLFSTEYADRLIVEGSGSCPPLCRIDPNGYNYLVVDTAGVGPYAESKGVDDVRQNLNGMTFDSEVPPGGLGGKQASVRYSISSYVRWDYDQNSGVYLRQEDAVDDESGGTGEAYQPSMDRLTNQQVAAENVVILIAMHTYEYRSASGNSEIIRINLMESGPAIAFRDGQAYQVVWNRPENESTLYLTFPDGSPYPFKPGNTWLEVIGESSKDESKKEEGIWRYVFSIP
jgi:hypothetical protein